MKYVTLVEARESHGMHGEGFRVGSWMLEGKLPYEQASESAKAYAESEKLDFDIDKLMWDEETCSGYYSFDETEVVLEFTPFMVMAPERYRVELEREFAQHS